MERFRTDLVVVGLLLAAGLVVTGEIVSQMVYAVKTMDVTQISVTGSAEQAITSNRVKWRSSFQLPAGRSPAELARGVAEIHRQLALVESFFAAHGVSADQLTVHPLQILPQYSQCPQNAPCTPSVSGFSLTQNLRVDSSQVSAVTKLANSSSGLVSQGVVFQAQPPTYYYQGLSQIRTALLVKAIADARDQAEQIAGSSGVALGPLRSVGVGVFQLTAPNSTQISGYGAYSTATIPKVLHAVLRATFSL